MDGVMTAGDMKDCDVSSAEQPDGRAPWRAEWTVRAQDLWKNVQAGFHGVAGVAAGAEQQLLSDAANQQREAFQLLAAAYIYHVNGVRLLQDSDLHGPAVPTSKNVAWDPASFKEMFTAPNAPVLCGAEAQENGKRCYVGSMHTASATLRLSLACLLLAQRGPFDRLLTASDREWDRGDGGCLADVLRSFPSKCPHTAPRPIPQGMKDLDIAILVADRDRMMHGDEGQGRSNWRRDRAESYRRLPYCAAVESQLVVMEVAVKELRAWLESSSSS